MSLFREELLDQAQAPAAVRGAHSVLVVDDEVGNLRVLRSLLGSRYQVHEAGDGAEALEVLDRLPPAQQPAVILSDQRMPRMTGVELFERLRERLPNAIRIIITGFVDVAAIVDAINRARIYQFVVKPFDHDELKLTVARAIESFEMRRQIDRHVEELESKVRARTRELEDSHAALKRAYADLERASLTDPLTGLGNRRALVAALQDGATPAPGARRALLLLDVDHFKAVNDEHGHDAGDAVLRGVAATLRAHCRDGEHLARWGGEEFLLAALVADEREACARAEQLRCAVAAASHAIGGGRTLQRSCSIGVACWAFDPLEPARLGWEQVLALADGALYMAKRGGRNAAVCLAAGTRLPAGVEAALAQRLPELLESGAIVTCPG